MNSNLTKEGDGMKKILIGIGILIAIFLVTWGVCEVANSNYYNYQGYVTNVFENEKGETVIVALSETSESTFTVKWYTKMTAPKRQPVDVGDKILLSTTRYSNTNIKKMKVVPGYSTEGKLVYVEGLITPFVLAKENVTQARYLVSAIQYRDNTPDGPKTGDIVKIYHAFPATVSVAVDNSVVLAEGSIDVLTTEDIAFIESQGYSLRIE